MIQVARTLATSHDHLQQLSGPQQSLAQSDWSDRSVVAAALSSIAARYFTKHAS